MLGGSKGCLVGMIFDLIKTNDVTLGLEFDGLI